MKVVVYGRPGCHLCAEAVARLRELGAGGPGIALEQVDIDADDELTKAYLERIPVVEIDGEVVSELVLEEVAVRSRLEARAGASRSG